jgi:hypothetical protein
LHETRVNSGEPCWIADENSGRGSSDTRGTPLIWVNVYTLRDSEEKILKFLERQSLARAWLKARHFLPGAGTLDA